MGIPRTEIVLFNSELYICANGNIADAATDINGCARFTGSLAAGGCVSSLDVHVDGVFICEIPVKINSPDHVPASPGYVDASDVAGLAAVLGNPRRYTICKDYNESGPPTIDAGDVVYFATVLGAHCP